MRLVVTGVSVGKTSFQNDWKDLSAAVQAEARERIKAFPANPLAGKLRLHALNGYHPTVYCIDVQSGKGKRHKATFILEGSVAVFQRIGTHKQIDRKAN